MNAEISLFFWSLEQDASTVQWARSHLSHDEVKREARFATKELRERYAVGRGVMRHILSDATGCPPTSLVFGYGEQGKPTLRDGPLFNLSHSRSLACLALTKIDQTNVSHIGIDIEPIAPIEAGLAQSVFAPDELDAYFGFGVKERTEAFFRCWTQKEAVMKATGLGLSLSPKTFSIDFVRAQLVSLPTGLPSVSRWTLTEFEPRPGVKGALAALGTSEAPKIELNLNWWEPCPF